MSKHTAMTNVKKYLLTGLVVWLPFAATAWVLQLLLGAVDQFAAMLPTEYRPDYWLLQHLTEYFPFVGQMHHIPGFGIVLLLTVLLVTGIITTNIFGQRILTYWESLMGRIPLVRSIYNGVKQVSDTIFSGSGQAFSKAVLVRFPHPEAWTIAFLTGQPVSKIAAAIDGEHINVYVPTTPNPTSGYFIMVRRDEVIELDMSVDEALKYVISMGVVGPSELPVKTS